jgi:formamidopyrimidine-DNA glycosylase
VLTRTAAGRTIVRVDGESIQMRRHLDVPVLRQNLVNRRISSIRRRGKYLLIDVDSSGVLLVHLGMSGRFTVNRPDAERLPHTHLRFGLDSSVELRLVDPRRFGFADWLGVDGEATDPSLSRLGMEPLDDSTSQNLPPKLIVRRSPIKSVLLDQRLVAGIGNIYAVEALWRARIHPARRGHRISLQRASRLVHEVQQVLTEAIEQGGTTIRDFAAPEGDFGYFAVSLQAYGRVGEPCMRCHTALRDRRIAGRTTPYCPSCQR